ncbi:alpha/beta-hydrolase [Trametes elegans]|nr:alpha/beta-hydrolase [Trametes elegans]
MLSNWDRYGRLGLDLASTATTLGFSAAKACTKLGVRNNAIFQHSQRLIDAFACQFSVTRGIASTAAGFTGTVIDQTLFGGTTGAGALLGGAVSSAISAVEFVALAPILLGETITSTSLVAAHSSLSMLTTIFPGSDEASFSLASFVGLVRREWNEPAESEGLPEERYGVGEVLRALAGFAALQGVTSEWQEKRWFKYMKEVPVYNEPHTAQPRQRVDSRVTITGDTMYPRYSGQIITADITEVPVPGSWPVGRAPSHANRLSSSSRRPPAVASMDDLKQTLRRLSKLVLAGYGGPSLLFFGVSLSPWEREQRKEEAKLADAIDASEREAAGPQGSSPNAPPTPKDDSNTPGSASYSWWNVLMGKHDHDIFLNWAKSHSKPGSGPVDAAEVEPTAHAGTENHMPRFWVLTDHVRREVVLVIRGTMSLNELAVDLTCDPAPFTLPRADTTSSRPPSHSSPLSHPPETIPEPVETVDEQDEETENVPGSFPFPMDLSVPFPRTRKESEQSSKPFPRARVPSESADDAVYVVHGGMLKMTRAMGAPGKPVHVAVRDALRKNKGYSLVLCGHSLGAGVAGLLALMWASPSTRLTHRASGLPVNRQVTAYCFAPPCLVSPRLSAKAGASGLITSFVYGHDIVSRLSLGSVRDLTRAASWLCAAENKNGHKPEGYSAVTKKALKWKMGRGEEGDEEWFLAIRKTLEANMQMADLFPPGRVFWALRDGDLHRAHQLGAGSGQGSSSKDKVRLFEVKDVKQVFDQIIFARDMLSSHLPHQYDKVLHELL